MSHLRYRAGTDEALKFPHIRYPWRTEVSAEQAEQMRQAMPEPDRFEVVESVEEEE